MKRLIDADTLSEKLCETTIFIKDGEVFQRMINDAPTVDAVEVVRCKDCRYWNNNKGKYNHRCIRGEWFYDGFDLWTKAEDYCSFGERRERDDKNTAEDKAL